MTKKMFFLYLLFSFNGLSSNLFAGNGANLIALTPQSLGQGGTGIASPVGVESLTKNPAMLSKITEFESQYGANIVLPNPTTRIQYSGSVLNADTGNVSSQTRRFVVPEIGFVLPYSDRITIGLGLFGTSGFGVDFRNLSEGSGALSQARMFLMSLKAVPGISYKRGKLALGASAHLGYGLLDFSAILPDNSGDYAQRGGGIGESFSAGYQLGAAYDICSFATLGATYQSSLPYTFKRVFDFDRNGSYDDFKFTFPNELGVGVCTSLGKWKFSGDIKQIYWKSAEGFKQLRFQDQTVYAIGTTYTAIPNKLHLRFGFNYSPSVVKNRSDLSATNGTFPLGTGTFLDSNIAYFDMVGLGPIVAGKSLTAGMGYRVTKHLELNGAIEYILKRTITQSGKTFIATADDTNATYSTSSSGYILSGALSWKF